MSYRDYLNSDDWRNKKIEKESRTDKRCSICADKSRIQLHHLFYRRRWTESEISDLRWLCDSCHSTTHQLINEGLLTFPKPDNHHSCFALTKAAVKKKRGLCGNMFYPNHPKKNNQRKHNGHLKTENVQSFLKINQE